MVLRDEETINPKLATGTVEVMAETLRVLGKSPNNLPFEVETSKEVKEDVRLKYRFLDPVSYTHLSRAGHHAGFAFRYAPQ